MKGVLGADLGGLGTGREAEEAERLGAYFLVPQAAGQEKRARGARGPGEEVPSWAGHSHRPGWGGAGDGEQI